MALVLTLALTGLVGLLSAAVLYFSWNFDYWTKRNVKHFNPFALSTILSTRFKSLPTGKPFWLMLDDAYWKFPDLPFVGFFQGRRPALVVRDPELIKVVLVQEFSSFHDRPFTVDEENDPLSVNLVSLEGERWRNLRAKLSPAFTSGKLKLMSHLMDDVTKELKSVLRTSADASEEVDMKSLLMRYSTDVIGSCAFGVECNSLKDPESEFFRMSRFFTDHTFLFVVRLLLAAVCPGLLKLGPLKSVLDRPQTFFTELMKETIQFREKNGVERSDFVSLMMKLRDSDAGRGGLDPSKHVRFDDQHMAAEAFVFFAVGSDAIANATGFCLHELAFDADLQRRAAEEVRAEVRRHDGELSFEAVRGMDLVERIVLETLRLYGSGSMMSREVTHTFRMPGGGDLVLDRGTLVLVPVRQLHHDPAHFPDPERFDPDRFTEEARRARHPYAFMPFGEGPRRCIAERFVMFEMRLCLAALLRDLEFVPGPKSEARPELDPKSFAPTPKNGFWLRVVERKQ